MKCQVKYQLIVLGIVLCLAVLADAASGKKKERKGKGTAAAEASDDIRFRAASLAQITEAKKAAKELASDTPEIIAIVNYEAEGDKGRQVKNTLERLEYHTREQKGLLLASRTKLEMLGGECCYTNSLGRKAILSADPQGIGKRTKKLLTEQDPDYVVFMPADDPAKDGISKIKVPKHLEGICKSSSKKSSGNVNMVTLSMRTVKRKKVLKKDSATEESASLKRILVYVLLATAIPLMASGIAVAFLRKRKSVYS